MLGGNLAGKDVQCTDVALRKRADYSEGLAEAIDELLGLLGGFDTFISPGDRVPVKSNLLGADRFNPCTCTDPAFIPIELKNGKMTTVVVAPL